MRKSTKGALAAGTAAVLLLGGAGSLAYWSAVESGGGGVIGAGQLALDPVDRGTWTLNGAPVADISTVRVVPGDEVGFRAAYEIVAEGDNLRAAVEVTGADATGALAAEMTPTLSTTIAGEPAGPITEADDGKTVEVVVGFELDHATASNASQNTSLDFSDLVITLTQSGAGAA